MASIITFYTNAELFDISTKKILRNYLIYFIESIHLLTNFSANR